MNPDSPESDSDPAAIRDHQLPDARGSASLRESCSRERDLVFNRAVRNVRVGKKLNL